MTDATSGVTAPNFSGPNGSTSNNPTPAATPATNDANFDSYIDELKSDGSVTEDDLNPSDPSTETGEDFGPGEDGVDANDAGDMVTLTVNGKQLQKPLAEVTKLAQQALAAGSILEKVKQERQTMQADKVKLENGIKGVQTIINMLAKGDLEPVIDFIERKHGSDAIKRAAINYAVKLYQYEQMTPEQREAHDAKRKLKEYEQTDGQRRQQEQQRAYELQVNQHRESIAADLPKALQDVGLPSNNFVNEHVLVTWRNALERGQNVTLRAVAAYVKKRWDEGGISYGKAQNAAPTVTPRQRPRATPASVGLGKAQDDKSQYVSYSEWKKNGRR